MFTPSVVHERRQSQPSQSHSLSPKAGVRSAQNLALGLKGIRQVAKSPLLYCDRADRYLHPGVGGRQQQLIVQVPANH